MGFYAHNVCFYVPNFAELYDLNKKNLSNGNFWILHPLGNPSSRSQLAVVLSVHLTIENTCKGERSRKKSYASYVISVY